MSMKVQAISPLLRCQLRNSCWTSRLSAPLRSSASRAPAKAMRSVSRRWKKKLAGTALDDESAAKTVTTKTFKMHDGQREVIEAAIAKAREAVNTKVDTVAL